MDTFVATMVSNGSGHVIPDPGELLPANLAVSDYNLTASPTPGAASGGIKYLEQVLVPILWGLIIIVGLLGNGLVVYVMLRYGERQTTNCYIVNLAFTDLAFVLVCVPFTMLHYIYPLWPLGQFMCKFTLYMTYVLVGATCLTLTAMTVDRYFAIVHPIRSLNKRTPRMATIISISIWIVSFITATPFAIYSDVTEEFYCREIFSEAVSRVVLVTVVTTTYIIPLTIIIVCYTFIIRNLLRHSLVTSNNNPPPGSSGGSTTQTNQMRKRRKAIKLVAVVVALFAFLWMPIHIFQLWVKFDKNFPYNFAMYLYKIIAHTLSYASSCVNPFVYSFLSDGFRKALKKAFPVLTGSRASFAVSQVSAPPAASYAMCPTECAPSRAAITRDAMTKMTSAETSPDVSPGQKDLDRQNENQVEFSTKYLKESENGEEMRVLFCKENQSNGDCEINEIEEEEEEEAEDNENEQNDQNEVQSVEC
uniref:Orphan G-protein coupled receptor 54 n=1 Tax=Platynereis dumerilii TaxID=6359 RepID=A0A0K0PUJ3_PLADU|nr:orphan G-protein coupled receptor 54 [Platynereis dumerilii]